MKQQLIKYSALLIFSMALLQPTLADPAQPPPPPPPDPPTGIVQNDYSPVTTIKSCNTDFDAGTNSLEYCNEPYRQTKTKNIYFCDTDGDNQLDGGDNAGSWTNPKPSCGRGNSYVLQETKQRTYFTCGKNDAEEVVNGQSVTKDVNKTTTVDDDEWLCPSTKALSMRHRPGDLDAGIGISRGSYNNLDKLTARSGNSIDYSIMAAVPACVNRVPMIKLDVLLNDDYSGEQTSKTGIYANHMNLYYGPGGSKGFLKDVELPEQDQFKRKYDVSVNSNSYRMWAWRQRFAGAVKRSVKQQNLQIPEDANVDQIAQNYRDSGKSVGDLWLSSDFLYGAEAGDPTTREVIIERSINSTCTQDVTDITEREFESVEEFRQFSENNEDQAVDILGKSGSNYCNLGSNQTLQEIRGVEPTGAYRQESEVLTGEISTKLMDNITEEIDAELNLSDLDATFINQDGQEEQITTSDDFLFYWGNDESAAESDLLSVTSEWQSGSDLSIREVTGVSDVMRDQDTETTSTQVNVNDLNATFLNSTSGEEEDVNTSQDFMYYLGNNEEGGKRDLRENREEWQTGENVGSKQVVSLSSIKDQSTDDENSTILEFDAELRNRSILDITAQTSRHMTGSEFGSTSSQEIYNQMEDNVLPSNNSIAEIMTPEDRFEDKMIKIDGVQATQDAGDYTGQLTVETVENVASETAYIYTNYEEEELEKNSWNWRALQGVNMTVLSKCLYNWQSCMNNERDLPSRSWDGAEVFDAGYGPWEKTNTFQWSSTAAQNKGESLQDTIDDSDFYNESLDISFDKYYDGARGSSGGDGVSVNVYRTCESSDGWKSEDGEFYHENHFICPESNESNQGSEASNSQVYRCGYSGGQLPAEQADEYEARKISGNWHVCRERNSQYKWIQDTERPEMFIQSFEDEEGNTIAQVGCSDDVASCEEESYRMKVYTADDVPSECPEDYSEYDEGTGTKEIGPLRYICATGKDKVGKTGFTETPLEMGSESDPSVEAELIYPSSTIKIPLGQSNRIFYSVENNADEYRDVNVSLGGVNASFVEGQPEKKSFTMIPNETKSFEIKLEPENSGDQTFWVQARDLNAGYQMNDTIQVNSPSGVSAITAAGENRDVPGVGLVHILVLTVTAAAYLMYRP
jgi:hypothetical protein